MLREPSHRNERPLEINCTHLLAERSLSPKEGMISVKGNLQDESKTVHSLLLRQSSGARGKSMLNLTTRTQKLIQMGITLAFGATLFFSSSAGAADTYPPPEPPKDDYSYCTKFEQVYAYTEFSQDPYQQLDVVCSEG